MASVAPYPSERGIVERREKLEECRRPSSPLLAAESRLVLGARYPCERNQPLTAPM